MNGNTFGLKCDNVGKRSLGFFNTRTEMIVACITNCKASFARSDFTIQDTIWWNHKKKVSLSLNEKFCLKCKWS